MHVPLAQATRALILNITAYLTDICRATGSNTVVASFAASTITGISDALARMTPTFSDVPQYVTNFYDLLLNRKNQGVQPHPPITGPASPLSRHTSGSYDFKEIMKVFLEILHAQNERELRTLQQQEWRDAWFAHQLSQIHSYNTSLLIIVLLSLGLSVVTFVFYLRHHPQSSSSASDYQQHNHAQAGMLSESPAETVTRSPWRRMVTICAFFYWLYKGPGAAGSSTGSVIVTSAAGSGSGPTTSTTRRLAGSESVAAVTGAAGPSSRSTVGIYVPPGARRRAQGDRRLVWWPDGLSGGMKLVTTGAVLRENYFKNNPATRTGKKIDWYTDFYFLFLKKWTGRRLLRISYLPKLYPMRYDLNALFAKAFGEFTVRIEGLSRGMFPLEASTGARAAHERTSVYRFGTSSNTRMKLLENIPSSST
ncbi:hypothetical protein C0995_003615 [Termitomyces sp. Mi166|nr:hypothetical protein C0995_003615 [Termitomyces sp. Mi166\